MMIMCQTEKTTAPPFSLLSQFVWVLLNQKPSSPPACSTQITQINGISIHDPPAATSALFITGRDPLHPRSSLLPPVSQNTGDNFNAMLYLFTLFCFIIFQANSCIYCWVTPIEYIRSGLHPFEECSHVMRAYVAIY